MLDPHPDLTSGVIYGLGWLYLLLFLLNVGWTRRSYRQDGHLHLPDLFGGTEFPAATLWATYSVVLLMLALAHLTGFSTPEGFLIRMPVFARQMIDSVLADARFFFLLSVVLFALMIIWRRWLLKPTVAWCLFNLAVLFMTLSLTDYDFRQIVGKPDNVPIVGMLYIVGFFTWLYFSRAVENDDRIAKGLPKVEEENNEKVLVWPDLVYTELICMVVLTVVLVGWGIALQAPLEEPASSVKTPNPSKAPWYFLGLQEMLVYFDPWLAGVVFPSVILVGLMAIPYIDFNPKGNGYYTFNERKFAIITFMFGFLPLWIGMIILGTFLRGPNWNIFGIYEYWDVHKLELLNNVNLSEWFWLSMLNTGMPMPGPEDSGLVQTGKILLRESPGLILVLVYLIALPPLMAVTIFRKFFFRLGFLRYMVFSNLVLMMAALPIKMVLRWTVNLKYLVAIPEWFFNI
ncbi:MAG: hypothetical protein KDA79_02210 [Planctomycetaceae bacterium]|nr:hypothetical protein [Planctomycetaceae bacterium]